MAAIEPRTSDLRFPIKCDDAFGLSHAPKFSAKTQIIAICNLLNNLFLIEGIKIGVKPMESTILPPESVM